LSINRHEALVEVLLPAPSNTATTQATTHSTCRCPSTLNTTKTVRRRAYHSSHVGGGGSADDDDCRLWTGPAAATQQAVVQALRGTSPPKLPIDVTTETRGGSFEGRRRRVATNRSTTAAAAATDYVVSGTIRVAPTAGGVAISACKDPHAGTMAWPAAASVCVQSAPTAPSRRDWTGPSSLRRGCRQSTHTSIVLAQVPALTTPYQEQQQ
jgi:hypothetical protein